MESHTTQTNSIMPYEIVYTQDGTDAFDDLEPIEQHQVQEKLAEIADCEFRDPRDWDFCRMEGCADGRFSIGRLRVFADIDPRAGVIRIHHVGRRENLYA